MKKSLALIAFIILLAFADNSCKKNEYKKLDCSKISSSYAANIKPIIDANCLAAGCHNSGSSNGDFTNYTGLAAKAHNGSINKDVLTDKTMPPSGALSLDDRKKIKCWIDGGSPNN